MKFSKHDKDFQVLGREMAASTPTFILSITHRFQNIKITYMNQNEYDELALHIGQAVTAGLDISFKPGLDKTISIVVSEKDLCEESTVSVENCQYNLKHAFDQTLIDYLSR